MRIEGHTDTVPIHTPQFASNWELSTARATELVKVLIENHGVSPERLSAAAMPSSIPSPVMTAPRGGSSTGASMWSFSRFPLIRG